MTNAELAILSLIAEQPRHGYEIEQVIEHRGMRNWTEVGFSSIYYVLKKLEERGLIAGRTERQAGQGPARRVFHITPAGEAAFREGILDALSTPQRGSLPFLLGLANLPYVPRGEALAALHRYRDFLAERYEHVRVQGAREPSLPVHVEAMFDFSLKMIEAELRWVEGFIKQLEEEHD